MTGSELPVVLECDGDRLVAMMHAGDAQQETGVVIVVGGPQYRVGSHRQFVLMARQIARAGFPVLRFDYRGMGDAEGRARTFEAIDDDIEVAVDALFVRVPTLEKVVLLGLCDAASAILMYCSQDERIGGLILINPWVRTDQGEARSTLKHYYLQRVLRRSFWKKVVSADFSITNSLREFWATVRNAARPGSGSNIDNDSISPAFISRMLNGLESFTRPVLILISDRDMTAREFCDLSSRSTAWGKATSKASVTQSRVVNADHTFSSMQSIRQASELCVRWLNDPIDAKRVSGHSEEVQTGS